MSRVRFPGPLPLVACALLLALVATPAAAQITTFTTPGPGGTIYQNNATVTVTNTRTLTTLCSYALPAGRMQRNGLPLHLKLVGKITSAPYSASTINLSANFGGSTATVTMVNTTPALNLSSAPVEFDLYLVPQSDASNKTQYLQGRFFYQDASATAKVYSALVLGTTSMNTGQTLAVNWAWASASSLNSLAIQSCTIVQGL